jgi:3-hydroxybutyryl-CoA dehydrogenase
MSEAENRTVGIVGAGTMGQGIAQVCAGAGYKILWFDVNQGAATSAIVKITQNLDVLLQKEKITAAQKDSMLINLQPVSRISDVQGEFIIEAAIEELSVKQEIFSALEEHSTDKTILLSNTSSIQIAQIARQLRNPGRFAGLHFFNPATIMRLVEIVQGPLTASETVAKVQAFAKTIGKHAVLTQDSPGFIVNRIARLYYVEALKALEEGVADHETIDRLMKNCGFRMGPFELMDLIGIDVNLAVTKSLFHSFQNEARFRPSRIQQQKVDAGMLGRKSGKGFYDYN